VKKTKANFKRTILASLLAISSTPALAINVINVEDPGITDVLFRGTNVVRDGHAGKSLASGDFDGDGIMDMAIGAPGMSSPRGVARAGNIFIYYGGSNSGVGALPNEVPMETTPSGDEDAMLYGALEKEAAGDFMTSGDFNNDGRDDLVIVAQRGLDAIGTVAITKVYVVYGSDTRLSGQLALSSTAETIMQRTSSSDPTFQVSALTTGNLMSDGADELVFSDTRNNTFYVIAGKNGQKWINLFNLDVNSTITLTHSLDTNPLLSSAYFPLYNQVEIAGVAIGDFNGDSTNDLALGVPNETVDSITNAGQVYVIYGDNPGLVPGALTLNTIADVKIFGGKTKDKIGGPLTMGDFNDDNIPDLMIGEPQSQRGILNATGLGQVQVVYGSATPSTPVDLFDQADITLHLSGNGGSNDVGRIGFETGKVLLADDVNGDDISDMVISTPDAFLDNSKNGWVHVVYGGGGLKADYALDIDADTWFLTSEPTGPGLVAGEMGDALAAGDFDDDGKPDLALGAPKGLGSNGGWVALLSNSSSKVGCSGEYAVVEASFPANPVPYICEGTKTLETSGDVVVAKGATVMFFSPEITLNGGFKVAGGGVFSADDKM